MTYLELYLSSSLNTWTVSVFEEQARNVPQGENDRENIDTVRLIPRLNSYSLAPSLVSNTLMTVPLRLAVAILVLVLENCIAASWPSCAGMTTLQERLSASNTCNNVVIQGFYSTMFFVSTVSTNTQMSHTPSQKVIHTFLHDAIQNHTSVIRIIKLSDPPTGCPKKTPPCCWKR